MEQTRNFKLPIIGQVQHGQKVNNKVTELGYFILKTKNDYMNVYLQKFDKQIKGKQSIDIEFFDEEPLLVRYVRYNQGGKACQCLQGSNKANLKNKNSWQQIDCDIYNCQYRQKNEQGKRACNRIGWLKFFIPSISTDRVFLMKITSQESITTLEDYISWQKTINGSIKGRYTIFLYQKEQTNSLFQTFNNYVLDILKTEDFKSEKTIPLSTNNDQIVNNNVVNQEKTETKKAIVATKTENTKIEKTPIVTEKQNTETIPKQETEVKQSPKTTKKASQTKETTKKTTKSKAKTEEKQESEEKTLSWDNIYVLTETFKDKIQTKAGEEKEYLVGRVYDMNDKKYDVLINPKDEAQLEGKELGTLVKLDIQEMAGKNWAMKLQVWDAEKNIAA